MRTLKLSTSDDLLLRLRWVAAMYGHIQADLAITGGVHTETDALKGIMAGAGAIQIVSALLENGPRHLALIRRKMSEWMEQHEYLSLGELQGVMSLGRMPRPELYERTNYIHILQSWSRD